MRKKKATSSKRHAEKGVRKNRKQKFIVCVCAIVFLAFATFAGPWSTYVGSRKMRSLFYSQLPPPLPSPGNPSKEYIYAGGRLIATEEPNPMIAPTNVVATTNSSAEISISWNASPNANHYVVERATQLGNFSPVSSNVSGTNFTDSTVTNLNAYLYRILAADAAGNLSPPSNIDVATAMTFADDPFATPPALTPIKAQHIVELRQAVNAVRHTVSGLGDATWSQSSATLAGSRIQAIDIEELRTALDAALGALGLPTGGYTGSSLQNEPILKAHITELRTRVK